MRLCIVGKYPPIQGGVSARTYWAARRLAARGHDVHVVTNAREVQAGYRMFMRAADWSLCSGPVGDGRVTVHWTDPVDRAQAHIPQGSACVSKLCGLALRAHAQAPFDLVYSHYMEPYGIAAHLAAQAMDVPHVARMAGSDAGRLWRHPQFELAYDHILRSAHTVMLAGVVAERGIERGIEAARIAFDGGFVVPEDVFTPEGPSLDIPALLAEVAGDPVAGTRVWGGYSPARPHFGVYGKLGRFKGSFALLQALARLKRDGHDVGLVALAHGDAPVEERFRTMARDLGLEDRVLQLPFVPHWRVPDFLRGCLAICCLEQDFPIAFHAPVIARETMLAGRCLVASTELIGRLPESERLPDRYGCVAIRNVNDIDDLAGRLSAIVAEPSRARAMGLRGRAFVERVQRGLPAIEPLESILLDAAAQRRVPAAAAAGGTAAAPAEAVALQAALDAAQSTADAASPEDRPDPLFRIRTGAWAIADAELGRLVACREPGMQIVRYDGKLPADLPAGAGSAFIVAVPSSPDYERPPLVVDEATAAALRLCDGTRSIDMIASALGGDIGWIKDLFERGLIGLTDAREGGAA